MLQRFFQISCFLFLAACQTGTPEPELPPIEIVVVDDQDQLIQDATVTFFLTEQDFVNNTNPLGGTFWKTDKFGRIVLDELDRTIPVYYMNVEAAEYNNWSDKVELRWSNNPKRIVIQIKRSISNYLAGRSSRKWKQVSQTINGEIFKDCSFRQNVSFSRKKRMFSYIPADCTPTKVEFLLREEPWAELPGSYLLLGDPASPNGGLTVTVLEANNKTFRYSYQPIRNGQRITVVNDYEVVQ